MTINLDERVTLNPATFPKSVQPGIPQLAVPRPGWTTRRFGDLLDVVQRPVRMRNDQEYDLVTVKRSRGGVEKRATLLGSQISVKSQFRIEPEDFLISRRQIVHGACAVVPDEFSGSIVSNEYAVLRCKPDLDLGFLQYLSHSIYFQQTCFHSSIGVHVEKMIFKLEDWLNWPVNVPNIEEQRRIGEGFTSMDAKLDALRRKKFGLEAFKSSLMQRLFSQELRFTRDDVSEYPEWDEKTLGAIGSFQGGGTPDTSNPDFWNGDTPWISSQDVKDEGLTAPRLERWITDDAIKRSAAQKVSAGTILIVTRVGVGKIAVADCDLCTSQDFSNLQVKQGYEKFVAFCLLVSRDRLLALAQGTSIKGIAVTELRRFSIVWPHLDEQRKIADALSAMDAKMAAVAEQIGHMETFKKGLLQQMFV